MSKTLSTDSVSARLGRRLSAMCGIAGAVGFDPPSARKAVEMMCDRMLARGPDDGGIEVIGSDVTFASRRLAIIDPSFAGHQPMHDPERGTTLLFNGMIYNFRELRAQLEHEGERFSSACDTEVVLRLYGRYGRDCVRKLRGMFAFAIWDERDRTLFLARDRLGIKPLYYAPRDGRLLFASQVKALLETGHIPPTLSDEGLDTYLAYGAVSEPLTAIEGIFALPAAHRGILHAGQLELSRYWEPPKERRSPPRRDDALEELRELLEDSVRTHLVSDAPLGVFLSGGLDSSLLAALATRHSKHVRTVSIVFDDPAFTETRYMESVAKRIGSEHVSLRLRPEGLVGWLDDAFDAMDQPTFDGINSYVVSRAAADTGLKVALSGLGADELFDGYGYVGRMRTLERLRLLPRPIAKLAAAPLSRLVRRERGAKASAWLRSEAYSSYGLLRRLFLEPDVRHLRGGADRNRTPEPTGMSLAASVYRRASELDLANYTKNVLLRDTDAMSMSRSLEVRVPYLDHKLVEWALRQPERTKGRRKALLTAAAGDLLPAEVLTRHKHGFALPLHAWMRSDLRRDVEQRIKQPPGALAELIDARAAHEVWARHLSGDVGWLKPWSLYALARWVESLGRA